MIKKTFVCCVILLNVFIVFAQKAMQYGLSSPSVSLQVPKQDKQQLLSEDEKQDKGRLRCAVLLPCNMVFPGNIVPETVTEGMIWRMKIEAEDAEAINLYLKDFQLPKGAELSFYIPDFTFKLPTVLSDENPENKIYVTDHLRGSSVIIELFAHKGVEVRNCFTIKDIGYMYRPLPQWMKNNRGFEHSGDCEVNVNCPEGEEWQNEKKGIARILLVAGGGLYYCSGSLINNARNDRTPFFLTASHCGDGATEEEYQMWKFYFNYESPSCSNPEIEPLASYITTGSEKIAEATYWSGSDFLLLKLDDKIASVPDIVFNGWNISTTPATSGVGIHHPQGDVKKISTYTKTLQDNKETHWKLQWTKTQTNWGVTEGGSSGSPVFDQNKYIVGTLSYGDAECALPLGHDYYGKMSYHWDKNGTTPAEQLKPWLDPDNTGITKLKGTNSEKEKPPLTSIKPNPTCGLLSVYLEEGDNQEIEVYDVLGRLVKRISTGNYKYIVEIDLSNLSAGFYIIKINNNGKYRKHKIIKI